MADMLV
jgi:hypothetical protein